MRHLAITLGTAALVIGVFLMARSLRSEVAPPATTAADRKAPESRPDSGKDTGVPGTGASIAGLPELEAMHLQHGRLGAAMRRFLAVATGSNWNLVNRESMQEVLHTIRYATTEADIPYLLDLFNRTKDPAFRWQFSWAVWQLAQELGDKFPGDLFVDPMTEVYRLDPARGYDALATINRPSATDRFKKLLDAEANPDMRTYAITSFAHSDWDYREDALSQWARDSARAGAERMTALTALGQMGVSENSLTILTDLALGAPQPVTGLNASLAKSHPIPDLRSAAVLALMQRGDQDSARRLMEAADRPGADADFTKIVDTQIANFMGPDLSELIYDRARRRGYLSAGEVSQLLRDLEHVDRARLRDLLPLVRDEAARKLVQAVISQ